MEKKPAKTPKQNPDSHMLTISVSKEVFDRLELARKTPYGELARSTVVETILTQHFGGK